MEVVKFTVVILKMQTVQSSSALYLFLLVAILHELTAAVSEPHLETLTHLRNTSSSLIIWGTHLSYAKWHLYKRLAHLPIKRLAVILTHSLT